MTKARDLANASTALSAVSATELGYLDGVTSAVQTQMDAKLATATASSTYQPLVSGVSNTEIGYLDGVTSAIQTQLNQKPEVVAGKNIIINGAFDFWQRGTSLAVTGGAFNMIADRWGSGRAAAAGGYTVSRQATGDTTNLPFIQYCMRIARNSGDTVTGGIQTAQNIETINSIPFAGRTVTISAYIRKGADYSGTNMTLNLNSGTGTDQNLNQSYTGNANVCTTTITPTTTWVRYSVTGTVASTATELALYIYQNASGTASTANDYIEITGVQLEVGSVATPFSRAAGTIQGELAACHRYYWRDTGFQSSGGVQSANDNNVWFSLQNFNPVPMRTTPTSAIEGSPYIADFQANLRTITSVNLITKYSVGFAYSSTKLTSNLAFGINFSDAGRALSFSSEL